MFRYQIDSMGSEDPAIFESCVDLGLKVEAVGNADVSSREVAELTPEQWEQLAKECPDIEQMIAPDFITRLADDADTLPGAPLDDDRLTVNEEGEIVPVEPLDDEPAGELLDEDDSPICAKCREVFTPGSRIIEANDGARFHARCWRNDR